METQTTPSSPPVALSVHQVMAETGLGRNTILGLVHSGRIRHLRIGRRIIIPRAELEAFMARELRGGEDE